MTKKKRNHPDIEELLGRPWCYYCERDFDDLKILINHQKAKHFKCERCGRRLNTAGGLSVHMNQVHKETLSAIENALPNRSNLDVEIFGMEGIPEDVVASHKQRVVTQFAQAEAEHRAATGNPAPGSGNAAKKPKFEAASDMKKRLAEHKAKVAAEKAAAEQAAATAPPSNGEAPPMDGQAPGYGQTPGFNQPYPQQYGAPPSTGPPPYNAYPQQYGQQPPGFQPPPGPNFPGGPAPPFGQQSFSPPGQYPPANGPYGPPAQYPTVPNQPPPFNTGSPAPPPFAAGTPPAPYRNQTPPQGMSQPQRPNSLPSAVGLPQRPAFGAPPVNSFQLQQMHQGQMGAPPSLPYNEQQQPPPQNGFNGAPPPLGTNGAGGAPPQDKSTLTLSAAMAASGAGSSVTPIPQQEEAIVNEKKSKKDKDKDVKMVYSDNEVSPEEKMARLPRYAFTPDRREETVLGDATKATVTGPVVGGAEEVAVES